MTKCLTDLRSECDELHELIRLDATPGAGELVPIDVLLNEARDLVRAEADAKSLGVIVVGVADEVVVNRAQVIHVLAALLRDAIRAVHPAGRVAVTAQEIERELVFAVFDSGKSRARSIETFVAAAAHALGGRVWSTRPMDGNLSLFAVPLARDDN